MPKRKKAQKPDFSSLWPFWLTAAAWAVLGVLVNLLSREEVGLATVWLLAIWLACVLDFAVTARLLQNMLGLRGSSKRDTGREEFHTLMWGIAKLACLGLIGVVVWAGKSAPLRAILMGMATLVVVPVLGGFWWYQKEQSDGETGP